MRSLIHIIRLQLFSHLIDGDVTLNVLYYYFLQIVRHTKPINVLKSYCSTPSRNPLTFMWLCHTFVSLKVNIFLLFSHNLCIIIHFTLRL